MDIQVAMTKGIALSNELPTLTKCLRHTEITCPLPELPPMATYNVTSLTYMSEVTYSCRSGYVISGGGEVRTCEETGTWTGVAPTCKSKLEEIGCRCEC